MIKRNMRTEISLMSDSPKGAIDEPVKDAIIKEIRSKYGDIFDTITTDGNKIRLSFDDEDALLEIEVRGTRCIPTLCIPLKQGNIELKQDIRGFVKYLLDETSDYFV